MKTNNLTKKIVAIILSVAMITVLMPYQSFADTIDKDRTFYIHEEHGALANNPDVINFVINIINGNTTHSSNIYDDMPLICK